MPDLLSPAKCQSTQPTQRALTPNLLASCSHCMGIGPRRNRPLTLRTMRCFLREGADAIRCARSSSSLNLLGSQGVLVLLKEEIIEDT